MMFLVEKFAFNSQKLVLISNHNNLRIVVRNKLHFTSNCSWWAAYDTNPMNIEVQASLLRVAKFGIANNFSPCMLVFEINSRRISNNPIFYIFNIWSVDLGLYRCSNKTHYDQNQSQMSCYNYIVQEVLNWCNSPFSAAWKQYSIFQFRS